MDLSLNMKSCINRGIAEATAHKV